MKAIAAARKAFKQDKIRNDLIALPPMTRIKIRVSAGVFEVSLIRVIEASKSVEVLWDRGIKREFKWGSVVFGSTDGQTVLQKPSELIPESRREFIEVHFVTSRLMSCVLTCRSIIHFRITFSRELLIRTRGHTTRFRC
jgi:hypothetical protein